MAGHAGAADRDGGGSVASREAGADVQTDSDRVDGRFETTLDSDEEGPAAALQAAEAEARALPQSTPSLGEPGPPLNRRSPFIIGLLATAGALTTYALAQMLLAAGSVLALIALAMFLAIGLDPAVQRLMRWRLPRWAAVTLVTLLLLGVVVGFFAAAIPPLITQTGQLVNELPRYLRQLNDHSSTLGRLDARLHLREHVTQLAGSASGGSLFNGLLGAGQMVLGAVASTLTVLTLTIYLLADMPRIRKLIYRLIPASRRPRAILLGDEMFAKVGGYVLGNLLTSLIAGAGTFAWLIIFHVPYPILLSIMVALFDLIPVIGAPAAGVIVSLVALTVSVPVAIATAAFYTVYKLAEDYLIVPRIIGRTVDVPATVTLVAVLIGGAALGLVGSLAAIPMAAALRLLLRETLFPRLDRT
jgi:predicted PurR-regulated permease PerM